MKRKTTYWSARQTMSPKKQSKNLALETRVTAICDKAALGGPLIGSFLNPSVSLGGHGAEQKGWRAIGCTRQANT